ncbi:MAG: glycoside hydrolase family 2 [Chloroflexi bacterium]|nr:MAG: glycoside hydrolase family 2 [Chloroflexota bacterium]
MTARPEYPRPQLRRRDWVNLYGEWEFAFGADPGRFPDRIDVPFTPQWELSRLLDRRLHDVVWYRRRFDAPPAERLVLHFGAVDYRATVWVNDAELVAHEGGHTPFSVDITRAVRERGNVLVVRAEDPATDLTIPRGKQYWKQRPEGIFYTPTTGIWQTVWLEPLPARAVEALRLQPDLATGTLGFHIEGSGTADLEVRLEGRRVGSWSGQPGTGSVALEAIENWSPERPVLYDVTLRLGEDEVQSYFGFRRLDDSYVQRLVLDQGYWPAGGLTAPSDADLRRDIELAKAMGFNGARKHQKVEDPRWLYWADRLGFLVWCEMPNFHQHTAAAEDRLKREWARVLERDQGHTCIVAWVPVNESFGGVTAEFLEDLYAMTHPFGRVSSNDGWEHARTDLLTLHDYATAPELAARYRTLESTLNPGGRPRPPFLPGYRYEGQPIILSEFGGVAFAGKGWGFTTVRSAEEFIAGYGAMVEALMAQGPVQGFCYTQLTDIEQEQNGLLTFDRRPKVDPDRLRPLTQLPKRLN